MQWLVSFLHSFPHLNLTFHDVADQPDLSDCNYLQFLLFWALVPCAFLVLLLCVVLIFWSVLCCCVKHDRQLKRRIYVRHVSNIAFLLNLICCMFAGLALYGNEQVNRGIGDALDGTRSLERLASSALNEEAALNNSLQGNVSSGVHNLLSEIKYYFDQHHDVEHFYGTSQRLARQARDEIVQHALPEMSAIVPPVADFKDYLSRSTTVQWAESERWSICLILLCAILFALFVGLVAVCRRSRSTSILFSTIGIFILIIDWVIVGAVLGIALALADVCADPGGYVESGLASNLTKETLEYFLTCGPGDQEASPLIEATEELRLSCKRAEKSLTDLTSFFGSIEDKTGPSIYKLSNHSNDLVRVLDKDVLVRAVRLQTHFSCSSVNHSYHQVVDGICHRAIGGLGLLLLGCICLGVMIFALLMVISKTWYLYEKRTLTEYVEVDEQDPFVPRAGEVQITNADFYGTHMYNPRSRDLSTSGAAGTSDAAPARGDEEVPATPLWLRNSPPPAYDSVQRANEARRNRAKKDRTRRR